MKSKDYSILIVDDEQDYCNVMNIIFSGKGYCVDTCCDGYEALLKMKSAEFDLILTDLMMPKMDGKELLQRIKEEWPRTDVIIMTAYGTIEKAVETMKHGAYTFITKGDNPESLLVEVEGLYNKKTAAAGVESDEGEHISEYMIKTESGKFKKVLSLAEKAAKSNANILILGESGCGKEVIARYIHEKSNRSSNVFMDLNCHSISENVLESELFGHEKGSFTGATGKRIGRFEAADHGTLFLDEIGDIPLTMQAKLLKVLENKNLSRMGSNEVIKVDFRLLSATNKDLEKEISAGNFREDLFYRLSAIVINVPALRERKEDLPFFIKYFIEKWKKELGMQSIAMNETIYQALLDYDYPGNVRELKNIMERLVVFSENGVITGEGVDFLQGASTEDTLETGVPKASEKTLRELRKELERKYINSVLNTYSGDMNKVSEVLGITRRQLLNKLTEYGLRKEKDEKE